MGWVLLKTLGSLVAVLGLMFALVVVLKKYMYGFQSTRSTLISIDVLGQRVIQPKRSIVVVKVLNKVFIIGMTEEGMQLLGEIDDEDILQWIDENNAKDETSIQSRTKKMNENGNKSFTEVLTHNLGFVRPKGREKTKGMSHPDFESYQ
jgi:flagellar biogenesis protein FliO